MPCCQVAAALRAKQAREDQLVAALAEARDAKGQHPTGSWRRKLEQQTTADLEEELLQARLPHQAPALLGARPMPCTCSVNLMMTPVSGVEKEVMHWVRRRSKRRQVC